VRRLTEYLGRCPDEVTKDELDAYFARLLETHSWSTIKLDQNGIRFFHEEVLSKTLPWINFAQAPKTQRLPDILTPNPKYQRLTLPLADFLWRIAMHMLPKGMQRVRNFGFLHGNARRLLQLVQRVLRIVPPQPPPTEPKPFHCSRCGSAMRIGHFIPASAPSG
jgi:hypothetical protein